MTLNRDLPYLHEIILPSLAEILLTDVIYSIEMLYTTNIKCFIGESVQVDEN